jgi:hypothetical protein
LEESTEQRGADPERRVGHDVIRPSGKAQIPGVGLHDDHATTEAVPQLSCPRPMGLDRDDPSAGGQQRGGDRSGAGTDVEDE